VDGTPMAGKAVP